MKKFTTLALALVTGAALTGPVMAAPKHGPNPDRMIEHMTETLDLSADQQSQLKTIFKEQGKKMRALHDETEGRIKAVLTPEQQEKAEAMREQRKEKWEERKEKMRERHGKE